MCKHVRLLLNLLSRRVVESFDQLHPALQKFVVRDSLLRPTFQDFVHSVALLAAETDVEEISVVNHLSDQPNLWVADVKLFGQRFKRAIVAAMSKPFFVE